MTLGLRYYTRTLHFIVWPIKIRLYKLIYLSPTEVKNATPEDFKRKHQTLLTGIGGKWLLNHMENTKPPIKRPILTFF